MRTERIFPDFPGHFEGDPLVPGAALLAWVQELAPDLSGLERVRFRAPLRPGERAILHLRREGATLRFSVEGPQGLCAEGAGTLGPG